MQLRFQGSRPASNFQIQRAHWDRLFFGAQLKKIIKPSQADTIQPDLFMPIKPKAPGLKRFAVIGDAGSGTKAQFDIGDQMMNLYKRKPFASVMVLGDNVYEEGEPKYFKSRIYKPYQALFEKKVRFYPIMGNHDVRQGYADKQRAYWGAPQFYNQQIGNVEFFALDTTVFLPEYDNCYISNPFKARKEADIQLQWLDKALAGSQAKYKIVMGHYPVYSSGVHGAEGKAIPRLRSMLEPVLTKHGVDVYLAGHEHHYEKSQLINGVQHFVTGGAGKIRTDVHFQDDPPYPREKLITQFHFMLFEERDAGLKYEVISRKGIVLDSGIVPRKDSQRLVGISFA